MKTERRHNLETNTLAKGLNVWGERLRPYTPLLTGGVAVLLAAYAIMAIWNSYGATRDQAAWDEYQMAILDGDGDLKQLQAAAASEENAGSQAMQDWAYVTWADRQLRMASDQCLLDRTGANKRLSAIAAVYDQFATSATDPEVRNRARLGLARVDELQNRPEDARKHYALVEGALSAVAAARIKELESKPVQEAEGWLATAKAPAPKMPSGAGTPGVKPAFGAQPPTRDAGPAGFDASQSLEEILGGLKTGKDEPARYNETPAAGKTDEAKTPADGAPAATEAPTTPAASPAAETPATTETPAPPPSPTTPAPTEPAAGTTPAPPQ